MGSHHLSLRGSAEIFGRHFQCFANPTGNIRENVDSWNAAALHQQDVPIVRSRGCHSMTD